MVKWNNSGQLKIQVLKNLKIFLAPEFSKKGQLKIQEMSFMLLAVMLFFILVGLFGISIMYSSLQGNAEQIKEEQALSVLENLANSPEFNCARGKSNCIDADKLIGLKKNTNYQNFWDFTSMQIILPSGFAKNENEMNNCIDSFDDCNRFVVYDKDIDNEQLISSYAAVCRTEYENYYAYEKCELGRLIVGREVQEVGSEKGFNNILSSLKSFFSFKWLTETPINEGYGENEVLSYIPRVPRPDIECEYDSQCNNIEIPLGQRTCIGD